MGLKVWPDGQLKKRITTTTTLALEAPGGGKVGSVMLFVKGLGAGDSVAVKSLPQDYGKTALTTADAVAKAYRKESDGSTVAGATTITADGAYVITADGQTPVLVVTIGTGPVDLYVVPMTG